MQNISLPKVLVVGINPWREDGTAHTLKEIFSCWDASRLALIYTKSGLPYTNVASRFFQISENLILKNLLKPWKTIGQEVESTKFVDESLTREEDARYAKAHKHHSMLLTICREIVWLLGHTEADEDVLLMAARVAHLSGKDDTALDIYNKVIDLNPFQMDAYRERGQIRYEQGDKKGAQEDMQKLLEMNPNELADVSGDYSAEGVEQAMKRVYSAINPFGL